MKARMYIRCLVITVAAILLTMGLPALAINAKAETDLNGEPSEIIEYQADVLIQEGAFPKVNEGYDSLPKDRDKNKAGQSKASQPVEEYIYEHLLNCADEIDIRDYNLSIQKGIETYYYVINSHPELFYVMSGLGYSYSGNYITVIRPSYNDYTSEDIKAFEAAAEEVLSQVEDSWPDFQKVLFIHDYIATHCDYDDTFLRYDAYNVIVEHTAVCQGYSLAFKYFMNQLDIPCEIITSEGGDHAWNAVDVDGSYYYIDVTHDDPLYAVPKPNVCNHGFFLLTTGEMQATNTAHSYSDWLTTDSSDAFSVITTGPSLKNSSTAFIYSVKNAVAQKGNQLIYCQEEGTSAILYTCDYPVTKTSELFRINDYWYVDNTGYYYTTPNSVMLFDGSNIYLNGPKNIYKITPEGTSQIIYTLTSKEQAAGSIYEMILEGKTLTYFVYSNWNKYYNGEQDAKGSITIDIKPVSVTVDDSLSLKEGDRKQLTVQITPSYADTTIIYSSSNPAVAAVNNGIVTAVSAGDAVITVTTDNNLTAACQVHIEHNMVFHAGTEPACEREGVKAYYECTSCKKYYLDEAGTKPLDVNDVFIPKLGHDYGEPVYTWSKDFSQVTGTITCSRDASHRITETVNSRIDEEALPTCEDAGFVRYTADFTKEGFETQTKTKTIPATGHQYDEGVVLTPAGIGSDGEIQYTCHCGDVTTERIAAIEKATVSKSIYTGKVLKPKITVTDVDGNVLDASYYTVSCTKTIKNVGIYTLKLTFNDYYSGTKSLKLTVNPAKTTIKSLTKASKAFTVKWTKKTAQVDGYQIQYSLKKSFSGAKTVKITSNKTTSKKITKLKAKKTYYVRIRTYKKVSGKLYYSAWSPMKSVKTK